jgi:predicted lipase
MNITDALRAVHLVESAYALPNIIVGNAQALVTYDEPRNEIQIAIAGSNDWEDWWQNLQFQRKELVGAGKVHSGFYKHAMLLATPILREIRKYPDGARIFMGCHSLGSAVSVILLSRYVVFRMPNVTTYLFGCPRVGNAGFAKFFHNGFGGKLYNIQNRGDPVCKGGLALLGWRHVGEVIKIGRGWDTTPDHPIRHYRRELANA